MNLMDFSKRYLLSETESRILDRIILGIQREDSKINIRSIAQESYVSTTTVVKLSKKLGYQGYSDMIYSLRRRLHTPEDTTVNIDLGSILAKVEPEGIRSFVEDLARFRHAKIFLIGLGYSGMAASYMMRRLATLGILSYDGSPIDMIVDKAEPSVALFLSKSGETHDLVEIAQRTRTFGHKIYTITACADSTLANFADQNFLIKSESGDMMRDIPDFYVGRSIILFEYMLSQLMPLLKSE